MASPRTRIFLRMAPDYSAKTPPPAAPPGPGGSLPREIRQCSRCQSVQIGWVQSCGESKAKPAKCENQSLAQLAAHSPKEREAKRARFNASGRAAHLARRREAS